MAETTIPIRLSFNFGLMISMHILIHAAEPAQLQLQLTRQYKILLQVVSVNRNIPTDVPPNLCSSQDRNIVKLLFLSKNDRCYGTIRRILFFDYY